jgi:hypothetical protein
MQLFVRQLVPPPPQTSFFFFLTNLDVCSPKSGGHKAVKFGSNTYFHYYYNLTKKHSVLRGWGFKCLLCVDFVWNDQQCSKITVVSQPSVHKLHTLLFSSSIGDSDKQQMLMPKKNHPLSASPTQES